MKTAHKGSWKTQPMPHETTLLEYSAEFSPEEFGRLSHGLLPQEMEDKWFIYLEGMFSTFTEVGLGHASTRSSLQWKVGSTRFAAPVNRDQSQYGQSDDAYDLKLLHFLISNLLLGTRVEFPVPTGLPKETAKGVLQHQTGYPEKPMLTKPWWKFW